MAQATKHICVVLGKPRGFTRSVLEALLKRGSSVMMGCSESDNNIGKSELDRLGQLYNSSQLRFSTLKDKCEMGRDIDKMFSDAKQQFGNINLIINSETSLYQGFNNHLENLAKKYMGKDHGNTGGVLLHVLSEDGGNSEDDIKGRASSLLDIGVKECKLLRPKEEFHDSEQIHITDDQHSPYNEFHKNSNYVRDWTGYMAIHTALNCDPGTMWTFDKNYKVVQVQSEDTKLTHILNS